MTVRLHEVVVLAKVTALTLLMYKLNSRLGVFPFSIKPEREREIDRYLYNLSLSLSVSGRDIILDVDYI